MTVKRITVYTTPATTLLAISAMIRARKGRHRIAL